MGDSSLVYQEEVTLAGVSETDCLFERAKESVCKWKKESVCKWEKESVCNWEKVVEFHDLRKVRDGKKGASVRPMKNLATAKPAPLSLL